MWVLQVTYIFQTLRLNFLKHFSLFANLSVHVMINDALTYAINMLPLQRDVQESLKNKRQTLMSLAILFHFLCAQHVSDINISAIMSLRLFCRITTLVYCSWFDVCWRFGVAGLEWYPCCRLKPSTWIPLQLV